MQTILREKSIVMQTVGFVANRFFSNPLLSSGDISIAIVYINIVVLIVPGTQLKFWVNCVFFLSESHSLQHRGFWQLIRWNSFMHDQFRQVYLPAFDALDVNGLNNKRFQYRSNNTILGNHLKMSGQVRS